MTEPLLFPNPPAEVAQLLETLPRALDKALPLRAKHRAGLPKDLRRLSEYLTSERSQRPKGYMAEPAMLSAYLRAFLPWNLVRLSRLLTGLTRPENGGLDLPDGATIADLGSGPLTFPLALWLARPDLRQRRLRLVCVDPVGKSLRAGLDVFRHLAGKESPWHIETVTAGVGLKLRARPDLLVMANTLNELDISGRGRGRTEDLARDLARMLAPRGRMLIIEPGIRRAVQVMTRLRHHLIEDQGFAPLAPCPHPGDCPLQGLGKDSWCHFTFPAAPAPQWLQELSLKAELPKNSLSLSFLYLAKDEIQPGADMVRMISAPFPLPLGMGQYGCSSRGLVLVTRPKGRPAPASGDLIPAAWPEAEERDAKSGALVMPDSEPADPIK